MQELYRRLCATATPEDFIGVTLSSERFVHGPAWISFRRVSDLSAYDLWDKLASVAQSTDNFEIDDTVTCHFGWEQQIGFFRPEGKISLQEGNSQELSRYAWVRLALTRRGLDHEGWSWKGILY